MLSVKLSSAHLGGPRGILQPLLLSATHIISRGRKRGRVMPIVALLQQEAFDPEVTHILTTAFDKAWDKFKSSGSALADDGCAPSTLGLRMQNCEIKYKKPTAGAGAQKSGNFRRRPRGYLARISAKFRKLFLLVFNADLATARARARGTSRVLPSTK
jgi:hypothetical protein